MTRPRRSRARRPAGRPRPPRLVLAIGALGVLLTLGFVYVGYTAPNRIPWRSTYTLRAEFRDADNLAGHAQVRLGGNLVGQVLDPRIEDGRAVADLQIDPRYAPLRSDTQLVVRPRSAIGVRFVEILPGTRGSELDDGATIPARQTRATRPLDEALGTFDAATRERLGVALRELGDGAAGRGEDTAEALAESRPFVADLGRIARAVAARDGALRRLVAGAATAAAASVPVAEDLADGFADEADAVRAVRGGDGLDASLRAAPGALSAAATRLAATRRLVAEVERLAVGVRPALAAAPVALRRTERLLAVGGPALRASDRTLRQAAAAEAPTVELLRTVRPVLPRIADLATTPSPILRELAPRHCDLHSMLANWADSMAYGNDQGNYLRLSVFLNLESIGGQTEDFRLPGTRGNAYPAPCTAGEEDER